jgi:hypothetical protein
MKDTLDSFLQPASETVRYTYDLMPTTLLLWTRLHWVSSPIPHLIPRHLLPHTLRQRVKPKLHIRTYPHDPSAKPTSIDTSIARQLLIPTCSRPFIRLVSAPVRDITDAQIAGQMYLSVPQHACVVLNMARLREEVGIELAYQGSADVWGEVGEWAPVADFVCVDPKDPVNVLRVGCWCL